MIIFIKNTVFDPYSLDGNAYFLPNEKYYISAMPTKSIVNFHLEEGNIYLSNKQKKRRQIRKIARNFYI